MAFLVALGASSSPKDGDALRFDVDAVRLGGISMTPGNQSDMGRFTPQRRKLTGDILLSFISREGWNSHVANELAPVARGLSSNVRDI